MKCPQNISDQIPENGRTACLLNFHFLYLLMALLVFLSGTALAQSENGIPIRRVYVPENQPELWPGGDWQPISTSRLIQAQTQSVPRMLQSRDGRVKQATYQATYSEGKFTEGFLDLELAADEELAGWIRFGKPNLIIESMAWSNAVESSSSDRWGIDANDRFVIYADGNTKRLSGTWISLGQKNGHSVEFPLRLMAASQSTFKLKLPEDLLLKVESISEVVTYVSEPSNGFRTWTILGLEEEQLKLIVQQVPPQTVPLHQTYRSVQLINISASGAAFTSDFMLTANQEPERSCLLWIPQEFRVQSVTLNLEDASRRLKLVESKSENGRSYRFNLLPGESSKAATLRVRGKIDLSSGGQLTTQLPTIMNEVSLEGEVNISIDAPYQVKSLSTSGLMQKSARFTDGTRDLWSFDVIEQSPEIKLQAMIPHAELKIDQIIHCREGSDQLVITHDMLWSPTAVGFYQAVFQLTNNFLVTEIQALNEIGEELPLSWTTERRNGKSYLSIDLANQIPLRKPILVRISLKPRTPLDRQQQISFPILTPVNGQVDKTLISSRSISITRTIPPLSEVKEAIDGPIYSQLKKMTAGLELNAWSENARIDDVSVINRFFVRRSQNESLTPMIVDELPAIQNQCELQTVLFEDQGKLFARHQISVPPQVTQSMNSLEWILSGQTMDVSWKRSGSQSDSTANSFLQSVQLYSNPSTTSTRSWTLLWESEPTHAGISLETVVPIPIQSDTPLAIPELLNSTSYTALVLNQATEIAELRLLSPKGNQQADPVSEFSYSSSESVPELSVHRLQTTDAVTTDPPALVKSSWMATLFCLPSGNHGDVIECELQCISSESSKWPRSIELKFPEPIFLKTILLNDTTFNINQRVSKYRLPEMTEQLQKVSLHYSCENNDSLVLPEAIIVPDRIQLIVCEAKNIQLKVTPEFPFWKFAENNSGVLNSSPLKTRMQEFVDAGTHQIYESEIFIPDHEIVRLPRVHETTSWKWICWSFVMSLFLFYFIYSSHFVSARWMLISAGVLTFLISIIPGWNEIVFLYPAICAMLIVAQLAPSLERWSQKHLKENPSESGSEIVHPLRVLILGRSLLTILVFLSLVNHARSQNESTTAILPVIDQQVETIEDVLIPISQAKLNTEFTGMTFEEFPPVVYVRNQYAEKLRAQLTTRQGKNDILFHSAHYSLRPDAQGEYVIHCEFDVIEKGITPLTRFILPISGISRISALRAEVNDQIVNMTPLPENQGLEIPLNANKLPATEILQPENPFVSGSFGRQSSPFRRYRIRVDVLPEETSLTGLTRLSMNIPNSVSSTLSYPRSLSDRLKLPNQIVDAISVDKKDESDQEYATIQLGSIDQLILEINNLSASGVVPKVNPLSVTEINTLLELYPQQIELIWQLGYNVVENSSREFTLVLPAQLIIQDIVGAKQIAIKKTEDESGDQLVKMEVSRTIPGKATCVIRFLATVPVINRESVLNLPQIVDNGASISTQLAVQTQVPGYDLTCQFVDAKASRLTQESFQKVWNDTAAVQLSAMCFRVQNAPSIRIGLQPLPAQLILQTDYVYQIEQKEILLNTTYQAVTSGGPRWSLLCSNESGWSAESVTLVSDGQNNGVRLINNGSQFQFLFEQPVNDRFTLKVNWKKRRSLKSTEISSSPPRILTATSLTESARVINSISRTQWSLSRSGEQNSELISSQPLTLLWTDKQSFRDLPSYQLNKIDTEILQGEDNLSERENVRKEPSSQIEKMDPSIENMTGEQSPDSLDLISPMLDHTVFQEGEVWNGETLIFWPADSTGIAELSSTIQIPAECKISELFPTDSIVVQQNSTSLQINATGQAGVASLLIHWKSVRPSTLFTEYRIDVPTSSSAIKTSWRIIDRKTTRCPPDRILNTWRDYTQILDLLGRQVSSNQDDLKLLNSELREFENEEQSPKEQTLEEFQNTVQKSLSDTDSSLHQGWNSIAENSWTTQSLAMYRSVSTSGSAADSVPQVTVLNAEAYDRWGLTLLTCIWGIGLVCYHATERPLFRKRHLFVISLMMIGLMLILMTTAST